MFWRETATVALSVWVDAMGDDGGEKGRRFSSMVVRRTHDCDSKRFCS